MASTSASLSKTVAQPRWRMAITIRAMMTLLTIQSQCWRMVRLLRWCPSRPAKGYCFRRSPPLIKIPWGTTIKDSSMGAKDQRPVSSMTMTGRWSARILCMIGRIQRRRSMDSSSEEGPIHLRRPTGTPVGCSGPRNKGQCSLVQLPSGVSTEETEARCTIRVWRRKAAWETQPAIGSKMISSTGAMASTLKGRTRAWVLGRRLSNVSQNGPSCNAQVHTWQLFGTSLPRNRSNKDIMHLRQLRVKVHVSGVARDT